ncbi:MAG: FkbM family methyltransferase [Myxococcota bacterium]
MTKSAAVSANELCSAFERGTLPRDQFWLEMRERHRLLEQYTELVGRGDLEAIEIRASGLEVVFKDGLRMRFRPEDTRSVPSVTVNHGAYEPAEVRALTALAAHSRVIFDVGANAGFMALKMAQASPRARVHAFEPVPSTFAELSSNIERNWFGGRIVPHACALGERSGVVKFYVPAFHGSVAASGRPLFAADQNCEVEVQMRTLDEFCEETAVERIDLLKCDVEGAEIFVLRGGLSTLVAARPVLMLEMLRKWAKVYDYHPNDIIALLSQLGYRCYSLGQSELVQHTVIDDACEATNFFFLVPERHELAFNVLTSTLANEGQSSPRLRTRPSVELSRAIRRHALGMVHRSRASHIGSCFSCADILAVLYAGILQLNPAAPQAPERDRFILSKGHAAAILYATLAERGFFPKQWLEHYTEDGSPLAGHAVHKGVPGVEVSTGSLGHGLPIGVGMALAAQRSGASYRTFVLMSDGECDEGSVWEAALFAAHHRLENLVAIVDVNQIQSFGRTSEVLELEPFADKWRAFGWAVEEVDGHDHAALESVLGELPSRPGKPTLVLARTLKGKGVSFMEDKLEWHYRSPNAEELQRALAELGEAT